jgi:hypothetical protein
MYCCTSCADTNPEACGYFVRDSLRVMPDGRWLCDGCFDEDYFEGRYTEKGDKCWSDYPQPPEYAPAIEPSEGE